MKALIVLVLVAACAAGCTVGPNYKRPRGRRSRTCYRGATVMAPEPAAADAASIGDQAWWDVFQDDQLQGADSDRAAAEPGPAHRRDAHPAGAGAARHHPSGPVSDGRRRRRHRQRSRVAERSSPSGSTGQTQRLPAAAIAVVGGGFLGQVPARDRGGARASLLGERVGPPGDRHQPRQPGGERLFRDARVRSRSSTSRRARSRRGANRCG